MARGRCGLGLYDPHYLGYLAVSPYMTCRSLCIVSQLIMSEINVTAVLIPKPEKFEEVSLSCG